MGDYSYLWNDMEESERMRLMPYEIESHIRHLRQARAIAVKAHRRQLAEIDDVIGACESSLSKIMDRS